MQESLRFLKGFFYLVFQSHKWLITLIDSFKRGPEGEGGGTLIPISQTKLFLSNSFPFPSLSLDQIPVPLLKLKKNISQARFSIVPSNINLSMLGVTANYHCKSMTHNRKEKVLVCFTHENSSHAFYFRYWTQTKKMCI